MSFELLDDDFMGTFQGDVAEYYDNVNREEYVEQQNWPTSEMIGHQETDNAEILPSKISINFEDVKGCKTAKSELEEYVQYFKNKDLFSAVGATISKGCLLIGPSGTGKTSLVRALAGQAKATLFEIVYTQGSFYCNGKWFEVSNFFITIKKQTPCVVLLDEIDSFDATMSPSIKQFLFAMDELDTNEGIIFLATSVSRKNILKELLKPTRFNKIVSVSAPTKEEGKEISEYYLAKIQHDDSVNVEIVSKYLSGRTGKEIKDLINQSAIKAVMEGKSTVSLQMIETMCNEDMVGIKSKTNEAVEKCKRTTAYREAGHALIRHYSKGGRLVTTCLYRPSVSRDVTSFSTMDTNHHKTKAELLVDIDVALGGRGAEEVVYGKDEVTSGEYCISNIHITVRVYLLV